MNRKQLLLVLLLIVLGFILFQTGIADRQLLFERIDRFSHHWWVWFLVLGLKVAFYTLALPGSSLIWIAAILYSPVQSTALIVCGGTVGSFLGYILSKRINQTGPSAKTSSAFFGILKSNPNFLVLCAARIIPGFPHAVINYGSGVLDVPWPRFVSAAVVGFAVKGYVYSSAIHQAVEVSDLSEIGRLDTIWPLLIFAALMAIGHLFQRYLAGRRGSGK